MRLLRITLKGFIGALVLAAICVMGIGVVLRYVVLPITLALDVDPVSFFWVEEVGEFILAWMAMVGAALGVIERTHFFLAVVTQRFPERVQFAIHTFNHTLIAIFGGVLAYQGWVIIGFNRGIKTPALELSLSWLFSSLVTGGILIVLFSLAAIVIRPSAAQHHVVG